MSTRMIRTVPYYRPNATIIVLRYIDRKLNWTMRDERVNIVVCPSNQSDFEQWQVTNDWSVTRYHIKQLRYKDFL